MAETGLKKVSKVRIVSGLVGRCHGLTTLLIIFMGVMPAVLGKEAVAKIRVGHVGHDHHLALFMALDNGGTDDIKLKKIIDKKRYALYRRKAHLADLEIIRVGGGAKMPTALAQNIIDIGFGGVAPVVAAVDKGAPLKLIAPLHTKGDMFVLSPKLKPNTWQEFVAYAKQIDKPVRIGYKSPMAVAKVIFEKALKSEGIPFSGNPADRTAKVHMINVKGGKKLNMSLANGIVDGYVGNNPFPAIGESKKIVKVISDLDDLPPGEMKNHPCCCIAATEAVVTNHPEVVVALLKCFTAATDKINNDLPAACRVASHWIGTSKAVEAKSIPTSGYSMLPNADWRNNMLIWAATMRKLGLFKRTLKGQTENQILAKSCNLKLVKKALVK